MIPAPIARVAVAPLSLAFRAFAVFVVLIALVVLAAVHVATAAVSLIDPDLR